MSSRVTRSAARRSAGSANQTQPNPPAPPPPAPPPTASGTASRKRKAVREPSPEQLADQSQAPPARGGRTKRTRVVEPEDAPSASSAARSKKGKAKSAMSTAGYASRLFPSAQELTHLSPSTEPSDDKPAAPAQPSSTRRGKGGRKSGGQDGNSRRQSKSSPTEPPADILAPTSRRSSRKSITKVEDDVAMDDAPEPKNENELQRAGSNADRRDSDGSSPDAPPAPYDEEDDDDDDGFTGGFLGRGGPNFAALRALAGAYNGQQARLRNILEQLKTKDPSLQLIALQELSELLLMATEDTLAGNFQADPYVKELVALLQPSDFGDDNPEMMLLACRCLANLMEALPAATANVVYGGAVPVLCSKLLEISFIDLAEQCLSVSTLQFTAYA